MFFLADTNDWKYCVRIMEIIHSYENESYNISEYRKL